MIYLFAAFMVTFIVLFTYLIFLDRRIRRVEKDLEIH